MTNEQVFEKVVPIIKEQLDTGDKEIKRETNFSRDLEADSLDIFEVVDKLEDEFDIEVETDDSMDTVGKLVDYITETLNK
ncbi:acyl carrier protein [Pediococcus argentinicus]|nr:acyl carrier protein [Pediococcus argentinicus]NKZ22181.1 acyl carrier protein [Pediococcus argentinicus]GEP19230.1 acyl carrier protein [Pediococcus argentinicus]